MPGCRCLLPRGARLDKECMYYARISNPRTRQILWSQVGRKPLKALRYVESVGRRLDMRSSEEVMDGAQWAAVDPARDTTLRGDLPIGRKYGTPPFLETWGSRQQQFFIRFIRLMSYKHTMAAASRKTFPGFLFFEQ